jgi:hypothetical protein
MTVAGTKMINGVKCVEVHDVVKGEGSAIEDTYDWYAQNTVTGDVWYFGEDTKELDARGGDRTSGHTAGRPSADDRHDPQGPEHVRRHRIGARGAEFAA